MIAQVKKVEEEKRIEISRLQSVVSMGHQEAEDRLEAELKAARERLEEEKRAHEVGHSDTLTICKAKKACGQVKQHNITCLCS